MLDTRLRVSPCSDRLSRSSSRRLTSTCFFASSYFTEISGRWEKLSLPLGPSIWIVWSSIETFTLAGMATGLRPIRDMVSPFSAGFTLVDHCQHLAADLLDASAAIADDASGRAQDLDAHAAQNRLELLVPAVDPPAG